MAVVIRSRIATGGAPKLVAAKPAGKHKILATTYFPERLPSQYLRRWRA